MGIKGLNPLIKKHAPNAFFTLPLAELAGKRISVDANGWMYANMATARKKVINKTDVVVSEPDPQEIRREWFLALINFVIGWLSYEITPIFVFDGPDTPHKTETKSKRRDDRIAKRAKIDALYEQLKGDILDRPANIVEELRKELRNYNAISPEEFDLFKGIIRAIGVPCFQAIGDGEQLCSMLCIEGHVAAVFSVDTDNLAYGCPLMITGFSSSGSYDEYGNRVAHVDCVRYDVAVAGLGLSHEMFVDLCIMCGCDFNKNIKGIAGIRSYGLLQKYGSIDALPRDIDPTDLKHHICRECFAYRPRETITKEFDDPIELEEADTPFDINPRAIIISRDYLEMVNATSQIERIASAFAKVKTSQPGYVQSLNLTPPPRYSPPEKKIVLRMGPPTTPPSPVTQPILRLNIVRPAQS